MTKLYFVLTLMMLVVTTFGFGEWDDVATDNEFQFDNFGEQSSSLGQERLSDNQIAQPFTNTKTLPPQQPRQPPPQPPNTIESQTLDHTTVSPVVTEIDDFKLPPPLPKPYCPACVHKIRIKNFKEEPGVIYSPSQYLLIILNGHSYVDPENPCQILTCWNGQLGVAIIDCIRPPCSEKFWIRDYGECCYRCSVISTPPIIKSGR